MVGRSFGPLSPDPISSLPPCQVIYLIYPENRATVTVTGVSMADVAANKFAKVITKYRDSRNWSQADLARESGLTQAEVSRVESGQRLPTMRIVKGLSEAFSSTTKGNFNEPVRYESWVAYLVDLGERVRIDARSGPGRWAKR